MCTGTGFAIAGCKLHTDCIDNKFHRRSARLSCWDYSQPWYYFVTICTYGKRELLGEIEHGVFIPSRHGKVVTFEIENTPIIRPNVEIDMFQVMPNHIHMIINITKCAVGAYCVRPGVRNIPKAEGNPDQGEFNSPLQKNRLVSPIQTIGSIVRGIKAVTTKQIRILENKSVFNVWQRNYYEHVIRSEAEYETIKRYICDNPLRWAFDRNVNDELEL